MNFAIVESGVVVNIIVGPLPIGMEGVALDASAPDAGRVMIGDLYADGVFIPLGGGGGSGELVELEIETEGEQPE